ncbi:hypothetical protein [Solibacillus sp. FSL W7-1324]|uniref:hypothetical protein n=1 Tax=Solibacillus sp. FSL W7-1324 TaxID=2921701 RepID=UPI0030F5CBE1
MRSKKTFLNLIVNILSVPVTALLGLWLTRLTIIYYGSDINGLNALITQIIAIILILEAGIGVAINSKLYKPYMNNDSNAMNAILTVGKKAFEVIAIVFSMLAFIIALILPGLLETSVNIQTIFILFILAFLPTSIYLFFSLKYKPIYDVSQSEYIFSLITVSMNIIGQLVAILFIYLESSIEVVRFWIMFFLIMRSVFIYIISRKRYKEFKFDSKQKNYEFLKDMPSVISLKITTLIYSTSPILYISFIFGTLMTSVYSVYNMIFTVLKSLAYAVVNAPFNAFGQLLADDELIDNTREKFMSYQLLVIMFISIILITCMLVIIPFVEIYTNGVTDVNYLDYRLAMLLSIITYLEIVHIPSGIMMQVTGAFKENKRIQNISTVVLVVGMVGFSLIYGLYGIMFALIICNLILGYLEIKYAHKVIFKTNLFTIYIMIFLNLFIAGMLVKILSTYISINGYIEFLVTSFILVVINSLTIYIVNFIVFKKYLNILNGLVINKLKLKK